MKQTIEDVRKFYKKSNNDEYSTIEWIKSLNTIKSPSSPRKPYLADKHSVDQVLKYVEDLKAYEEKLKTYKVDKELYIEEEMQVNALIELFIKEAAGMNLVPEQFQDKLYKYVCDNHSSDGYYTVYTELETLIAYIFK